MMFRLVSDLHLEFKSKPLLRTHPQVPYLVLAGDICTLGTIDRMKEFLKAEAGPYDQVLYVLGNHEYYQKEIPPEQVVGEFRRQLSCVSNLTLLDNEVYKDDRVSVFGTTLWSAITEEGYSRMTDSSYLTLDQYRGFHDKAVTALEEWKEPCDMILTHHMPSYDLIHPTYRKYGASANSGFATDCSSLFHKSKRYWVYGHTHKPSRATLQGIEFVCNPFGYPGENRYFTDCLL